MVEWKEKDEAVLMRALEKGSRGSSPSLPRRRRGGGRGARPGQRGEGRRDPAGVEWGQEVAGCRVWRWSSRRWPAALLGGGRRRSAPAAEEAERERGGR